MNDAIEAAALAMYFDPRSAQRNRDMAERGIAAAAPLIEAAARADERAKTSTAIADAITAQRRPGITAMLEGGWNHAVETAAGIARQHASARPAYPSHGNSADVPGEQQRDGTGNPTESHAEPRTGVATPNGINATPGTTQTA